MRPTLPAGRSRKTKRPSAAVRNAAAGAIDVAPWITFASTTTPRSGSPVSALTTCPSTCIVRGAAWRACAAATSVTASPSAATCRQTRTTGSLNCRLSMTDSAIANCQVAGYFRRLPPRTSCASRRASRPEARYERSGLQAPFHSGPQAPFTPHFMRFSLRTSRYLTPRSCTRISPGLRLTSDERGNSFLNRPVRPSVPARSVETSAAIR